MVSPEPASPSSPSSRHPGWAPSACSSSSAANKKMQSGALPLGAPGLAKNPRESWRGRMVQDPETRKWGLVVLEEGDKLHVQFGYVSLCSAHTPPVSPSRRQSSKEKEGTASRRSSQGGEKSPVGEAAVDMLRQRSSSRASADLSEDVVILLDKRKIKKASFAAIGVSVYTKVGIGVLIGFRPEHDIHVVRCPHFSTTAYLQRDMLIGVAHACPELPVTTQYGVGICTRENKKYGTWTIKLSHHEHAGEAYLAPDRFVCDARFVPLVESGKRKWKRKQYKTYSLLAKLQKVAAESGVMEKIQDAYEAAGVPTVYDTAKKAWDTTVAEVEKEVVAPILEEEAEDEEDPGREGGKNVSGKVDLTQTAPSSSSCSGDEQNAFRTPPAEDLNNTEPADEGDNPEDGEFRDAAQGDEELQRAQKYVEDEAGRLRKVAEAKLEEHSEIVNEVYGQIEKLEKGKDKMLETLGEFGEKAAQEIGQDEDIKEVVKMVEQAKEEAAQVLASELEKGTKVYESSKMASMLEDSRKRLEDKLEKLQKISGQQIETTGAANVGTSMNKGLSDFYDKIASKNALWHAKGSALFGSVQRRYLAGPDGWIAKTRKKLQLVLKEDQLGLKQWDFSTYTSTFYSQATDLEREVVETTTGATKERAKFTKRAVNSAAEQLVAFAKPEESATELLAKLDRMRGMEVIEALDLQGILDKAGIVVPSYVSQYFTEDENDLGSGTFDIVSSVTNAQGDKVLQKVLDDKQLIGKAQELVGGLEEALDKVGDLAQNKTVQGLLASVGGAMTGNEGNDAAGTLMDKLETLDVDQALELTEQTLADLQDPVKRAHMVDSLVDSAVDGLMSLLPKIHIDNLEGESNDFSYLVGNIDLGGFKLRKECVNVKINFETATAENLQQGFELVSLHAWSMSCILEKVNFSFEQQTFPYLNGEGIAKCFANDISLRLGFSVRWKNGAPQLYMSRRAVDIDFLTMEIEESWFSALYNVLIGVFSNLIRNYVNDNIEDQIDKNVSLVTGSLDMLLGYDAVKPWLASLAPRDKDGKLIPELIPTNDPTLNALPLSSERRAAEAKRKADAKASKDKNKAKSPARRPSQAERTAPAQVDPNAYYNFRPQARLSQQESIQEFAEALAQMTVMRSMLKSLKTGKPVTRGQVQQVLFSALYAVEDEAVKACLSEIHELLTRPPLTKKSGDGPRAVAAGGQTQGAEEHASSSSWTGRVGGFVKSMVGAPSSSQPSSAQAQAAAMQEVVSGDERKQLIFGLGLALSLPKFQQPTLQVREMNKKCQRQRRETDPNKLVKLSELRQLTICWSDFNRKMSEDLDELRKRAEQQGEHADLAVVNTSKFKTVTGNLSICHDALLKIKLDLTKSSQLRDRRQLETILLHLLDAVRCHTDGSDLLHELTDERQRERRSRNSPSRASRRGSGGSEISSGSTTRDSAAAAAPPKNFVPKK